MIKVLAYSKFDLAIHIERKKIADGYYPVNYIDCQIDIWDKLTFVFKEKGIEVVCDDLNLTNDQDNFVFKAAVMFKKIIGGKNLGAKITLEKHIPIKAGFGGGSSDAAATILGLSRLWKIKFSEDQIRRLAKTLGKDFYYSLYGKLSEVVGKGKNYEVVPFSSRLPEFWLLVVVPNAQKPSTGWVYEHLKTKNIGQNFDKQSFSANKIGKLKAAISKSDKMGILENLTNDFEDCVSIYYPIVQKIKKDLKRVGAEASIMAGSGLSVVGFFESKKQAQDGKQKLENMQGIKQIFVSKLIS